MKVNKETKKAVAVLLTVGAACIAASVLSGCGSQGPQGAGGPMGPAGTPSPSPSVNTIQEMVNTENEYRQSVGQELLLPGLDCNLYTVPTTTTAIIGATGLVGVGSFDFTGVFNQPNASVTTGLNILPTALQSVYQTWYIVKCTGDLVVADNNWHEFDVNSDDGSNLYIDGLLINNDGLHAQLDKSASKYLKYGFHFFELDFLQANGNEALILNEDGAVMSSSGFYH